MDASAVLVFGTIVLAAVVGCAAYHCYSRLLWLQMRAQEQRELKEQELGQELQNEGEGFRPMAIEDSSMKKIRTSGVASSSRHSHSHSHSHSNSNKGYGAIGASTGDDSRMV